MIFNKAERSLLPFRALNFGFFSLIPAPCLIPTVVGLTLLRQDARSILSFRCDVEGLHSLLDSGPSRRRWPTYTTWLSRDVDKGFDQIAVFSYPRNLASCVD